MYMMCVCVFACMYVCMNYVFGVSQMSDVCDVCDVIGICNVCVGSCVNVLIHMHVGKCVYVHG